MLDRVEWEALPEPETTDGLYATHVGYLDFGAGKLRCYVLNDERRVFDADDVAAFFGGPWSEPITEGDA